MLSQSAPDHASPLSEPLAAESCNPDGWYLKGGYRFKIATTCTQRRCQEYQEYVVMAVPVGTGTGTRNFCSASDGVIRALPGAPWEAALTPAECKTWTPIP